MTKDIVQDVFTNKVMFEFDSNGLLLDGQLGFLRMNIASAIFSILTTVGLFVGTGYLLDEKIDL